MPFRASLDAKELEGSPSDLVWAIQTMRRAIAKGGIDSEIMLERTEGKVKDRAEINIPRADGYTEDELAAIAQIEIARKRRENGKAQP